MLSPGGPIIYLALRQGQDDATGSSAGKKPLGQSKPPTHFCPHRQISRIRQSGVLASTRAQPTADRREQDVAAAQRSEDHLEQTAERLGLPSLRVLSEPHAWVPPLPGDFAAAAPPLSACVPLPLPSTNDSYQIVSPEPPQRPVAYTLEPLITIESTTVFGLMRGLETAIQMTAADRNAVWVRNPSSNETDIYRGWHRASLPGRQVDAWIRSTGDQFPLVSPLVLPSGPIEVRDSPFLSWRGMLLDTARHFSPTEAVARAIQGLAWTKANVLHWHPVDAQAFAMELPGAVSLAGGDSSQPRLLSELSAKGAWSGRQVHSVGEVTALVLWAAEHGVRIVPEVDVPGHTASWSLSFDGSVAKCPSLLEGYVQ